MFFIINFDMIIICLRCIIFLRGKKKKNRKGAQYCIYYALSHYVLQTDRSFKILCVQQLELFFKNFSQQCQIFVYMAEYLFGEPGTQYNRIYNIDYYKVTSSQNVWIAIKLA